MSRKLSGTDLLHKDSDVKTAGGDVAPPISVASSAISTNLVLVLTVHNVLQRSRLIQISPSRLSRISGTRLITSTLDTPGTLPLVVRVL